MAVPGVSSPRTRLQPPQVRSWPGGHSGSTRSSRTKPALASARTQSPRVRWCSTYPASPVSSTTSTYGVRSQYDESATRPPSVGSSGNIHRVGCVIENAKRPPGRSTRAASPTTACSSATNCSAPKAENTTSKMRVRERQRGAGRPRPPGPRCRARRRSGGCAGAGGGTGRARPGGHPARAPSGSTGRRRSRSRARPGPPRHRAGAGRPRRCPPATTRTRRRRGSARASPGTRRRSGPTRRGSRARSRSRRTRLPLRPHRVPHGGQPSATSGRVGV